MQNQTRWKIDPVPPLAIIEDNEDGLGIAELYNREAAESIVRLHNEELDRLKRTA